MAKNEPPPAEEIVLYEKDPATKIATITFDRPDRLHAPTVEARLRYADLLHQANVDDDVKVLVVRATGDDFGSGADLPDFMDGIHNGDDAERLKEFKIDADADVTFPPKKSFRNMGLYGPWFSNAQSGCRTLQEFNKISIVEVKGYCYGWHFYQAADADLVIASDDALFGHAAFRYVGWGPRLWTWAMTMGIRRFQEMLFTGRPFTAEQMYECGFLNKVVTRDQLEEEVQTYAKVCALNRPTDTIFIQKTFFQMMKQHQGEYMGSLLTGMIESMGSLVRPDHDGMQLDRDTLDAGLTKSVKANDESFPPEFRLSKAARKRP